MICYMKHMDRHTLAAILKHFQCDKLVKWPNINNQNKNILQLALGERGPKGDSGSATKKLWNQVRNALAFLSHHPKNMGTEHIYCMQLAVNHHSRLHYFRLKLILNVGDFNCRLLHAQAHVFRHLFFFFVALFGAVQSQSQTSNLKQALYSGPIHFIVRQKLHCDSILVGI